MNSLPPPDPQLARPREHVAAPVRTPAEQVEPQASALWSVAQAPASTRCLPAIPHPSLTRFRGTQEDAGARKRPHGEQWGNFPATPLHVEMSLNTPKQGEPGLRPRDAGQRVGKGGGHLPGSTATSQL